MSLHIKKLSLQYAYLELEKKEVETIWEKANNEMTLYIQKHFPDEFGDINKSKPKKKVDRTPDEGPGATEEWDSNKEGIKNKDLKKLYRKIASKTHPDKIKKGNDPEIFLRARDAYAENNLAEMLSLSGELNIELAELSPESVALLKQNIDSLSKVIKKQKNTSAWVWSQLDTDEQKKEFMDLLIKKRKGEI